MLSRSVFRTTNHLADGWVYSEHAMFPGVVVIETGSIDDYGEVLCATLASTLFALLSFMNLIHTQNPIQRVSFST